MTPLDKFISEAKARCEAAKPGPWFVGLCFVGESCWCRTIGNKEGSDDLEHAVSCSGEMHKNNAPFVAHARTDLPLALEIIEKQENILDQIYAYNRQHLGCILIEELTDEVREDIKTLLAKEEK